VLQVFDLSGRLVRTLASSTFSAGGHPFQWNGLDSEGRRMVSGLYVYRLQAGKRVLTLKTVLGK
jgi:flagellar hook assembly protein FlgD